MSGIVAYVDRRPGTSVAAETVAAMLAQIPHRGRDGFASKVEGMAGLGCAWTDSTGEISPPLRAIEIPGVAIAADCRLDNRADLVAQLGIADGTIADADLILLAYLKWGRSSVERLEGDFAFVIWDRSRRALFACRDRFGVKPFYYRIDADHFAAASEMGPLLAVGSQRPRLREAKVSAFLAGLSDDPDGTVISDISRLPARHALWLDGNGLSLSAYWSIGSEPIDLPQDQVGGFRERFEQAVAARCRGPKVGVMLSGGLDSSSISAVAARLPHSAPGLPAYSVTFDPGSRFDETYWIENVLAAGGSLSPRRIAGGRPPLDEIDRIVAEQEGSFLAPGLSMIRSVYKRASDDGVRALLDGHGGDEVVSHGHSRLNELAAEGRWLTLWRECRGAADLYGYSPSKLTFLIAAQAGFRGPYAPLFRFGLRVGRKLLPAGSTAGNGDLAATGVIRSDLFRRTHVADRARSALKPPPDIDQNETSRHRWLLSSTMMSDSFEVLDKAAAHAGIEPRYPFWDRRLVEYCLALPSSMKLQQGWTRFVLRKAMEGVLPPVVQWRRDKIDFKSNLATGMVIHHDQLISNLLDRDCERISAYVDIDRARASYARVKLNPREAQLRDIENVWRSVVLDRWLRLLDRNGIVTP